MEHDDQPISQRPAKGHLCWRFPGRGNCPATAQNSGDIVSRGANKGDVTNWTAGYIQVEAIGTSKATSNKIQMELLAVEGARLLAEAKLLKAIQGVRIIGTTTMANFTETNVKLASKIEGVIRGAIAVK